MRQDQFPSVFIVLAFNQIDPKIKRATTSTWRRKPNMTIMRSNTAQDLIDHRFLPEIMIVGNADDQCKVQHVRFTSQSGIRTTTNLNNYHVSNILLCSPGIQLCNCFIQIKSFNMFMASRVSLCNQSHKFIIIHQIL